MENPIGTFRWFYDVAKRRPKLVTLIGFGLLAEAARVWIGLDTGERVTLLGRSGFHTLDSIEDEGSLIAYAFWVAFCGALLVILTWFARRSARRAAAPAKAIVPVKAGATAATRRFGERTRAVATPTTAKPVVQRMRKNNEMRRR